MTTLQALAASVADFSHQHIAALNAAASDITVDTVLAQLRDALSRMASIPADSLDGFHAKAQAIHTTILRYRDQPAAIVGDQGLAASLVADLLRGR